MTFLFQVSWEKLDVHRVKTPGRSISNLSILHVKPNLAEARDGWSKVLRIFPR